VKPNRIDCPLGEEASSAAAAATELSRPGGLAIQQMRREFTVLFPKWCGSMPPLELILARL
jgi:hypothetical protein